MSTHTSSKIIHCIIFARQHLNLYKSDVLRRPGVRRLPKSVSMALIIYEKYFISKYFNYQLYLSYSLQSFSFYVFEKKKHIESNYSEVMKVTYGLLVLIFYYFLLIFLRYDYWSIEREYRLIRRFPLFRFDGK